MKVTVDQKTTPKAKAILTLVNGMIILPAEGGKAVKIGPDGVFILERPWKEYLTSGRGALYEGDTLTITL
jgi:hypothetical protein